MSMTKAFNPEMLIVARGARGLSQADVCRCMKWSQGKGSKIEHGLIQVPDCDVEKLAAFLQYPVGLFYESARVAGFGSCCQYHRKRSTTPIRTVNRLHDEVNIRRIQLSRLIHGVELPQDPNLPALDIDEYESPEEIARLVRATWNLPRGPIRNLVATVEAAGSLVMFLDLGTPKIDAVSQRAPGMPPIFFLDNTKPMDRCRYTLAHEIGHIVMHSTPSPNAEEEADRFASEFLMPSREIKHELTGLTISKEANLKLKWRASMQALIRKAKDSKAISASRYQSLCVRISQLGFRKIEPNPLAQEKGVVIRGVIDVYLQERGYTIRELSEAILCNEEEFRRDYLEEDDQLRGLRVVN